MPGIPSFFLSLVLQTGAAVAPLALGLPSCCSWPRAASAPTVVVPHSHLRRARRDLRRRDSARASPPSTRVAPVKDYILEARAEGWRSPTSTATVAGRLSRQRATFEALRAGWRPRLPRCSGTTGRTFTDVAAAAASSRGWDKGLHGGLRQRRRRGLYVTTSDPTGSTATTARALHRGRRGSG